MAREVCIPRGSIVQVQQFPALIQGAKVCNCKGSISSSTFENSSSRPEAEEAPGSCFQAYTGYCFHCGVRAIPRAGLQTGLQKLDLLRTGTRSSTGFCSRILSTKPYVSTAFSPAEARQQSLLAQLRIVEEATHPATPETSTKEPHLFSCKSCHFQAVAKVAEKAEQSPVQIRPLAIGTSTSTRGWQFTVGGRA